MINVSTDNIILFSLVFIRTSAIVMTAPLFGSPAVPVRIKMGLGLVLTLILLPLVGKADGVDAGNLYSLVQAAFRELLIGVSTGFMASLIFAGINLAGQLMGFQMGFAIVNVLDPINQAQVSIISQFVGFMALVIFVSLDAHHLFIRALADSFALVRPGTGFISNFAISELMKAGAELFLIALKVGAPVIAILLFVNVGLGIVARTVPQMNVFIVGFPLTIGVGLMALGLTLPFLLEMLKGTFDGMGRNIYILLKGI